MKTEDLPEEEKNFQRVYVKAPSFLSIHMGVKAEVLPPGTDCHHFILEVCDALWKFGSVLTCGIRWGFGCNNLVKLICCHLLPTITIAGWLGKFREALWEHFFEHSDCAWFILGSGGAPHFAHFYDIMHRGLEGYIYLNLLFGLLLLSNFLKYSDSSFASCFDAGTKLYLLWFQGLGPKDYEKKKELVADEIISRLENKLFPALKSSIVLKEVRVILVSTVLPFVFECHDCHNT